jgi:hypothetical protein
LFDGSHYTTIEYPMAQFTRIEGMADGKVWGSYNKGSLNGAFIYSNGAFTDIRFPGAQNTWINWNNGVVGDTVTGTYWSGTSFNGTQRAFIYDGTSYRDCSFPDASYTSINGKSGNLFWGSYSDSNWQWHGFVFDGTTYTSIDYPGATYTTIYGGVGGKLWGSFNNDNNGGSFLYESGHYTEFQYPGANYTWITSSWSSESQNKAVGLYGDNNGWHGFIYDGTTFTPVDYPQSYSTQITGYKGNQYWGSFSAYNGSGVFLYENGVVTTINVPNGISNSMSIHDVSGNNVIGSYWNGSEQKEFVFDGSTFSTISYPGASYTSLHEVGSKWVTGSYNDGSSWGGSFAYLLIDKAAASISFSGTNATYDGTVKSVTYSTTPSNLAVDITYNGSSNAPSNAGTYSVVAEVNEQNYTGVNSTTLVIAKASPPAFTFLSNSLNSLYTGSNVAVTLANTGSVPINITYNGSSNLPSRAGTYTVVAMVADTNNYSAYSVTNTLVISNAATPTNVPVIYEHSWNGWIGPKEKR